MAAGAKADAEATQAARQRANLTMANRVLLLRKMRQLRRILRPPALFLQHLTVHSRHRYGDLGMQNVTEIVVESTATCPGRYRRLFLPVDLRTYLPCGHLIADDDAEYRKNLPNTVL